MVRPSTSPNGSGARAALYLRVSTDKQDRACQLPDVERVAAARGLAIVARFEETASGSAVRPQLKAMLTDAHAARFDVVVVWALDRLGRSMCGNIETVLALDRCGVQVVSVTEPWLDTAGPMRDLLLAVFSWIAEQEARRIRERTRAGLEHARAKGIRLGRPPVRFDLAEVERLLASGASYRQVACKLRVGATTIRRAVQRQRDTAECAENGGSPAAT